jgi:flagellar assembly protein FliH
MSDPANTTTRRTRVIPADEAAAAMAWAPPAVAGGARAGGVGMVTARQIETLHKEAYDEGFAQGRREALEQARTRLEALTRGMSAPLSEFDEACLEDLVLLVKTVARALVRRELRADPGEIMAVVREAMAALPSGARQINLHLHPEDARLVREALSVSEGERHWRIIEDPTQERGGCRAQTEVSTVNADLETRLNAVVSKLLGGRRDDDIGA